GLDVQTGDPSTSRDASCQGEMDTRVKPAYDVQGSLAHTLWNGHPAISMESWLAQDRPAPFLARPPCKPSASTDTTWPISILARARRWCACTARCATSASGRRCSAP